MIEMPYISQHRRRRLDTYINQLMLEIAGEDIGEFNYVVTKLLQARATNSYSSINEIVGVLECIKLEFYRRFTSPYEDKKIIENGDVY